MYVRHNFVKRLPIEDLLQIKIQRYEWLSPYRK